MREDRDSAGLSGVHDSTVDDGDEYRFCTTCAFGAVCLSRGVDKPRLGNFIAWPSMRVVTLLPWALRSLWTFTTPRIDGKPG